MPAVVFPEWRDNNEKVNYPFSDAATLENENGDTIGIDILLDARIYPIGGAGRQYLSKVAITSTTVTLTVSDAVGELAFGDFTVGAAPASLDLVDVYGRPAGILVSTAAAMTTFGSWGLGDHLFEPEETEFAASVVVPVPQIGLRGFLLEDGTFFTRDTPICGSDGVVVTQDTDGAIRVDVIGEPLFNRKVCEDIGSFVTPRFLKTINGIAPDAYGNFGIYIGDNIVEDPILRFEHSASTLRMTLAGILLSENSRVGVGQGGS